MSIAHHSDTPDRKSGVREPGDEIYPDQWQMGARSGEQSKEDGYGPWGRRTGPLTSRTGNLLFRRYDNEGLPLC
jgi:hypothetical protein